MAQVKDLKSEFLEDMIPQLKKELGINNTMALPKLTKITVNVGFGTYVRKEGKKDYSHFVENLKAITGQQPVTRKAKKSVSNFKVREGDTIGAMVTLRGQRMYDFLNKLIKIVFPRVRDFRGLSPKAFDGRGNYSIGFKEHTVFPEIEHDDVINLHGLQVTICTSADNDEDGRKLLDTFGFPFKKTN